MATVEDLKAALRENLEERGVLDELRARVRAEIFSLLDDTAAAEKRPVPEMPIENLIINELVREYLQFNHYDAALSVFLAEAHQPRTPATREALETHVGCKTSGEARRLPLLYGLVAHTKQQAEGTTHNKEANETKETREKVVASHSGSSHKTGGSYPETKSSSYSSGKRT